MSDEVLRPIGWARAALGALLVARTTGVLFFLDQPYFREAVPLLGWPDASFRLSLGWWALSAGSVKLLCVVRTVAVVAFALGVQARWAGVVVALTGYAVVAQEPPQFTFTMHLLYLGALLLGVADGGATFALRPELSRSPASSVRLMHVFVASIYLWSGIAKLRGDWLDGRTLELFHQDGGLRGAVADTLLSTPTLRALGGSGVAVLELALGPALLWRRTRQVALIAAFGLHGAIEVMAHPDVIGWGMAALLLCFLKPRDVVAEDGEARAWHMTPFHGALALWCCAALPALSYVDGSGWLAWTMFSKSATYRITLLATDAAGAQHYVAPTALAARAERNLRSYLSGTERWKHAPVGPHLRGHLDELTQLACEVSGAASVSITLQERATLDAPTRTTQRARTCTVARAW